MSPPVVAESIVAAISEGTSGSSKAGKQTAGKPSRPFAQTAALANARQASQADNTGIAGASKARVLPADKSALVTGALSDVAPAANSRGTQGQTAQGLETLVAQAAGWGIEASQVPVRLVKGQLESTTSPETTGGKAPVPQPGQSVLPQSGRLPAGIACPTAQVSPAKGLGELSPAPVHAEGAILPKDELGSLARQVTTEGGKAAGTVSSQLVGDGRSSQTTDKSVTVVREHVAESKQVEAKATIPPVAESNVQRMEERQERSIPGLEQRLQSNAERAGAEKATPSAETVHNSQQVTRETPSQGHESLAAGGDNAQARPATPAGGNVMSPSQLGDSSMVQSEQAASEAGRSAPVLRLAPDQMSTAEGFEDVAAKSTAQSIGEQIRDSIHASLARGEREVVVRLQPPELGNVLVRFQEQNDQIHGVLEVSRSDARREIEQALPQVLRNLQDLGVQVRKLEVTVSDQAEKDLGRQQLQQEAWSQQQGYDRYAGRAQQSVNSHWSAANAEPQEDVVDPADATAAGPPLGRIDMLV